MAATKTLQMHLRRRVTYAVHDYLRPQVLLLMEKAKTEMRVSLLESFPCRAEVSRKMHRIWKRQEEEDAPEKPTNRKIAQTELPGQLPLYLSSLFPACFNL